MEGTTQRIPVDTQSCSGPALIRPLILQDRQNECFLELTYCFRVLDPGPIHLTCEIFELDLHKGCSLRHRESLNPITVRVNLIRAVLSCHQRPAGPLQTHTEQLGTHVSPFPTTLAANAVKATLRLDST